MENIHKRMWEDEQRMEWQERTEVLLGYDRLAVLRNSHVLIVGVGGVGGMAAEMLCRAGVGRFTLLDSDVVAPSNINRQIIALHSTIGRPKVQVLAERLRDINPGVRVDLIERFLEPNGAEDLLAEVESDVVVDAIDTIQPKCDLIASCIRMGLPVVSSLGAGAKDDISMIKVADLWKSHNCPLGKIVRKRLTAMGLRGKKVSVVFCAQLVRHEAIIPVEGERNKKTSAGTISYMPATFGCHIAAYVVNKLMERAT